MPIGYSFDGVRGVGEPRGMLAREFGVDMHVVTADVATARNLMLVVERCHLEVETMVAAPYVAGLAAIADDVTPELALETIESITVLGALQASKAIKAALAGRIQ